MKIPSHKFNNFCHLITARRYLCEWKTELTHANWIVSSHQFSFFPNQFYILPCVASESFFGKIDWNSLYLKIFFFSLSNDNYFHCDLCLTIWIMSHLLISMSRWHNGTLTSCGIIHSMNSSLKCWYHFSSRREKKKQKDTEISSQKWLSRFLVTLLHILYWEWEKNGAQWKRESYHRNNAFIQVKIMFNLATFS